MGSCPDSGYIYTNEQLRETSELLCSVLLLHLSCGTIISALLCAAVPFFYSDYDCMKLSNLSIDSR